MKVYQRTENGVTATVSQATGMDEITSAMMGVGREQIQWMSSINRTDYAMKYRDGRDVRLVLTEVTGDVLLTPPNEVEATLLRAERQAERRTQEPVEEPAAETDDAPWTVAGHRMLLHKFTEASADGRAVCNKGFRPYRYGNGYVFKTRAEHTASEYSDLYTFCPRCEKK